MSRGGRPRDTLVLAAGGTGGHLFPAEALARVVRADFTRIVLITDERGLKFAETFPADETVLVEAATLSSGGVLGKVRAAGRIVSGLRSARRHLQAERPAVVVGFGGYPSFPALAAAATLGLPCVIHEQNAILGRTNRALARGVRTIACSFGETAGIPAGARNKVVVTGNPVRAAVVAAANLPYPNLSASAPVQIAVIGGSQGAQALGRAVPQAIAQLAPDLRRRLQVSQQVRAEDHEQAAATYREAGITVDLAPFFTDMADRLARAHLVIARAGASTLAELTAIGRPAILVPLPSAMDDQQTLNARALVNAEAGWLLPQPDLTPDRLAAQMSGLFAAPRALVDAARRARALGRVDAAEQLGEVVLELAFGSSGATRNEKERLTA